VKVYTYLNFDGLLLLHGYDIGNPLCVSARSMETCIEQSFHLLLNLIVNNQTKPSSGLLVRPETSFDREPMFYQLSGKTEHFTVIPSETIHIISKKLYYSILML
jgi:hypothetical protein